MVFDIILVPLQHACSDCHCIMDVCKTLDFKELSQKGLAPRNGDCKPKVLPHILHQQRGTTAYHVTYRHLLQDYVASTTHYINI